MKKILVTGHLGFIGQHLIENLKKSKEEIPFIVYDWKKPQGGFLDFDYKSLDWVIHLGAISSTTETDVNKIMEQNLDYSIELYKKCKKHGVSLQFASSASVYGNPGNQEQQQQIFSKNTCFSEETTPPSPLTPYAWSKYLFERYVAKNPPSTSMNVQIFRYFNVYGPEHEEHKIGQASPFYTFERQKKTKGYIELFEGSHVAKRDFVHVSRVIDIHHRMRKKNISGTWNIGSGSPRSFFDVANEIATSKGSDPCEIKWVPMPEHIKKNYQWYTCADMTKLNNTLLLDE